MKKMLVFLLALVLTVGCAGFERKRTLASFAHAHFLSHPELARRFWG